MNTKRISYSAFMVVFIIFWGMTGAQIFDVVDADGEYSIWRLASGDKEPIRGNSVIGVGDTLFTPAGFDVTVKIESNTKILVKGGSIVTLGGRGAEIDVSLYDGQIFLDRNEPHELTTLRILTLEYIFMPAGTAAAVKTTPQGVPTVAVLRGAILMQSADGASSVTVGVRQFGTVNPDGQLISGSLSERGILQLEAWTGVTAEEKPVAQAIEAPLPAGATVIASTDASAHAEDAIPTDDATLAETAVTVEDETDLTQEADADTRTKAKRAEYAPTPLFAKPDFELSVGMATVNNKLWPRFVLSVDIPVWRFGISLDLEFFIDSTHKISNKGWDFSDNTADAIFRKIRYIRYGHETDPLFVKFGGLSNVTLGYGIIMNRFANTLNYPDEKPLGLQLYLNDISNVGITLQTLISDFAEVGDDGGIYAARLAVTPFKSTNTPLLNRFSVGATYAHDRNTYAPARKWTGGNAEDAIREDNAADITRSFSLYGFDAGVPIVKTNFLGVDLYGQTALRADNISGWGIGAPGVAVKLEQLHGNLEYRKISGRFTPGFFDQYYLNERLSRAYLQDKSEFLDSVNLQGAFGFAEMDMYGLFRVDGSIQYLLGDNTMEPRYKDRRYEATCGIGDIIINLIPKISLAEVYLRNEHIGRVPKFDKNGKPVIDGSGAPKEGWFFDRSPFMYWGYRVGFEIAPGASLIWDYRYGWKIENDMLVSNNHMFLKAALRF